MDPRIPARLLAVCIGACVAAFSIAASLQPTDGAPDAQARQRETLRIGVIAKSQNNLVFQAAHRGALHAGATLGPDYGVEVEIVWRTPRVENADEQADLFRGVTTGEDAVDAVAISVVSPEIMTPLIDDAVSRGVPVVTFDGDAPESARFAYYGEDNREIGRIATRLLCERIGGAGTLAVMIANTKGQNAQDRLEGMRDALRSFPDVSLWEGGLVKHAENFHAGRARMREVHLGSPEIDAWVLLSSFPLFSEGGLKWTADLPPERRPAIVGVDALPPQLPYLKRGDVDALVAQDCFAWGYESVRLLLDALARKQRPDSPRVPAEVEVLDEPVDAERWVRRWDRWLRRRPGR